MVGKYLWSTLYSDNNDIIIIQIFLMCLVLFCLRFHIIFINYQFKIIILMLSILIAKLIKNKTIVFGTQLTVCTTKRWVKFIESRFREKKKEVENIWLYQNKSRDIEYALLSIALPACSKIVPDAPVSVLHFSFGQKWSIWNEIKVLQICQNRHKSMASSTLKWNREFYVHRKKKK